MHGVIPHSCSVHEGNCMARVDGIGFLLQREAFY